MIDYTQINYEPVFRAYDEQSTVKALVGEISGKGHQVFVFGCPAFLPTTQEVPVDGGVNPNDEIDVRIIKIMPETNKVVVSAKVAAQAVDSPGEIGLEIGQIVPAVIKNVTPFGAFVTTGQIDGLIHVTELSYSQVKNPYELVSEGQKVNVKVIGITEKHGKKRVEFSLKQAQANPYDSLPFEVGDTVEGTVTSIQEYGAFLKIGDVSAMLHRSKIVWDTDYPSVKNCVREGETLKVKVISIDKENRKIAVSLRDMSSQAWDEATLSPGDILETVVLKHSPSGAGIIIGEKYGIQGFLPRKEMAWTKDESKVFDETTLDGEAITVTVMEFDKAKRRLFVSRRPLLGNPYDEFIQRHPAGSIVEADIVKNLPAGKIKVALPFGEFRITFDQSEEENWDEIMKKYPVGGKLPVKVDSYDPEDKRITFVPGI